MLPLALRVGYKLGKYALKGALKAHSAYYYGTLAKEVSEGKTEGLESHAMFTGMGKIKPITTKLKRVLIADRKTGGLKRGREVPKKTTKHLVLDSNQKYVDVNTKALKSQIRHVQDQAKADIKQAIKEKDPNITVGHSGSHGSNLMANIYRKAVLRHNKTSSNKLNYQELNLDIKVDKMPQKFQAGTSKEAAKWKEKHDWVLGQPKKYPSWINKGKLDESKRTGSIRKYDYYVGAQTVAKDTVKHKSKDLSYQDFKDLYPTEFKTELGITRERTLRNIFVGAKIRYGAGDYVNKRKGIKLDLSNVKTAYQPRIKLTEGKYRIYEPGSIKGKNYTEGGSKIITKESDVSKKYSPMFQGTDVKSWVRMAGDKYLISRMARKQRVIKATGKKESIGIVTMSHPNIPTSGKNPLQKGWYKKKYDKWMRDDEGDRMTKKEMLFAKQSAGSEGQSFSPKNPTGADPQAFGKDLNISTKDGYVTQVGQISTASLPPTAMARDFVNWFNQKNLTKPLFKGKISINNKTGKPIITGSKTKVKEDEQLKWLTKRKEPADPSKSGYGRHPRGADLTHTKITESFVHLDSSKSKDLIDPAKTFKFKKKPKKPKKT